MTPFYHIADSHDPRETLALEETLFNRLQPGQIVLYLYRHTPSVIIGRAQNAWAECDLAALRDLPGILARRITGGGAVYHDENNLNFSFISAADAYNQEEQMHVVLRAVNSVGIRAELSGRNDILTEGKKFSGNAWLSRPQGVIHHGTLMVDTDLDVMQTVLNVPEGKMRSKGVKSVRSRVVNLAELAPGLTVGDLGDALLASFETMYGPASPYPFNPVAEREARTLAERNASWDWVFGRAPGFSADVSETFDWGRIEISWTLKNRALRDATVYSDALEADFASRIGPALENAPFTVEGVAAALAGAAETEKERRMAADIAALITRG